MSNFNSGDILVFPSSERVNYRESRLFTEQNTVSIVNRMLDVNSFVISPLVDEITDLNTEIELNIGGYYFKFKLSALTGLLDNQLNGYYFPKFKIKLNRVGDYFELSGTDDNGLYNGLSITFISTPPTEFDILDATDNTKTYEFIPFKIIKTNNTYEVEILTHFRLNAKRLFGRIDCGEI